MVEMNKVLCFISVEILNLWNIYMNDSLNICMVIYFL